VSTAELTLNKMVEYIASVVVVVVVVVVVAVVYNLRASLT
jgi:hypothetical protein